MSAKTIVNVDDDPMIRTLVREILCAASYTVVSVEEPLAAIRLLEESSSVHEIECFILDVEMPGMNGIELLQRLKADPKTERIPVIMLTCQSAPEDFITGYNAGASYYITKPFTSEQLLFGVRLVSEFPDLE